MVLSSLNSHLGIADNVIPKRSVVVISDYKIDGNFLLHHFVSHYIKNDGCVSILGLSQTSTHYKNAGHKLGMNLQNLKMQNYFQVIDGLGLVFEGFDSNEDSMFTNPVESSFSLKSLWDLLKERLLEMVDIPHLLIIDDITTLINIGVSVQAVMDFIHYCKVFTTQHNVSVVVLCHSNEQDEDYTKVLARLVQYSTLHIHVSALKTGYSRELSGEMKISFPDSLSDLSKLLHFKLLDKDVRFFAPGTSSAVL